MRIAVTIIFSLVAVMIVLLRYAELQSTIAVVIDKGGIWFNYTTGLWKYRFVGFQVRLMPGHKPRAWMRLPYYTRLIDTNFTKTIRSVSKPRLKFMHIPIKGALDIGTKLVIREFDVRVKLGVEGDAAATALLCGGALAMFQFARALIVRDREQPNGFILIKPEFAKARFSVRFKCIVAIKLRHIIWEVIKTLTGRHKDG